AAASCDAGNNCLHHGGLQLAERHVVQEEQRRCTLHQDVVHAVVHQVVSNRVVPVGLDGNLDLGTHTIGTGNEQRTGCVARHLEHPAESAKCPASSFGEGGLHQLADALL